MRGSFTLGDVSTSDDTITFDDEPLDPWDTYDTPGMEAAVTLLSSISPWKHPGGSELIDRSAANFQAPAFELPPFTSNVKFHGAAHVAENPRTFDDSCRQLARAPHPTVTLKHCGNKTFQTRRETPPVVSTRSSASSLSCPRHFESFPMRRETPPIVSTTSSSSSLSCRHPFESSWPKRCLAYENALNELVSNSEPMGSMTLSSLLFSARARKPADGSRTSAGNRQGHRSASRSTELPLQGMISSTPLPEPNPVFGNRHMNSFTFPSTAFSPPSNNLLSPVSPTSRSSSFEVTSSIIEDSTGASIMPNSGSTPSDATMLHHACRWFPGDVALVALALEFSAAGSLATAHPTACPRQERRSSLQRWKLWSAGRPGSVGSADEPTNIADVSARGVATSTDCSLTSPSSGPLYNYPINIALASDASFDVIQLLSSSILDSDHGPCHQSSLLAKSSILCTADGPDKAGSLGIALLRILGRGRPIECASPGVGEKRKLDVCEKNECSHGKADEDLQIVRLLLDVDRGTAAVADQYGNYPLHHLVRWWWCGQRCAYNKTMGERRNVPDTDQLISAIDSLHRAYPTALATRNFRAETPVDIAIRTDQLPVEVVDHLQHLAYGTHEATAAHLADAREPPTAELR
jgi:hypothetical protein